jgi:putative transposase
MRKSKLTEAQISYVLAQAAAGIPVKVVVRQYAISQATFYAWRKKYGGLKASELKRMKQLEDENRRLKRWVADLSLDKKILQEVLAGKLGSPRVAASSSTRSVGSTKRASGERVG